MFCVRFYYLFFVFLLYFTISHWNTKYELYSGVHFYLVLTVSENLVRQKTLHNSYHLGDMYISSYISKITYAGAAICQTDIINIF